MVLLIFRQTRNPVVAVYPGPVFLKPDYPDLASKPVSGTTNPSFLFACLG